MIVDIDEVDIPLAIIIFCAIPREVRDSYKVRSMNDGEYYSISIKSEKVAIVLPLSEKQLEFTYYEHQSSLDFKRIMENDRNSKKSSDLRWVVFVHNDLINNWERISAPEISMSNALNWIGNVQDKKLMILVSFVGNEVNGNYIKTRSANHVTYIDHILEVNKSDMGAVGFQVSNWEK
jgi:hypothetical protein